MKKAKCDLSVDNPYLAEHDENPQPQLELQKLHFLQAIECDIKNQLSPISERDKTKKKLKSGIIKQAVRNALYYSLVALGLLQDGASSYIFANTLINLIPGVINPVAIVLSALFCLLHCILFYAFEVSLLKSAFGGSITRKEAKTLRDTYAQQVKITNTINQLLFSIHVLKMKPETYKKYVEFAILFNNDLKKKRELLKTYHQPLPLTIFKWSVVSFGVLSNIAGNYFFACALLAAIAPALVSTPIGWGLILLYIATWLGFHYAMHAKGVLNLMNKERIKFQNLKDDLTEFKVRDARDFEEVSSLQQSLKSTQTTDTVEPDRVCSLPVASSGFSLFSLKSDEHGGADSTCPVIRISETTILRH